MNDIKFITLDNGLTVLIYSDKTKMTNHVELTTFIGGMTTEYIDGKSNFKNIKPGTAHLLEHYVCENSIKGDLMAALYDIKAIDSNAITYPERTVMYFDTVYNFNKCLLLFLEGMYSVTFTKDRLDKAKYAVYNEIRDCKDDIERKIYWTKVGVVFNKSVDNLGTKTSVKSIGYKYLKDVYDNFYVPKNQFLVVTGNFDEDEVINIIKNFYDNYSFLNNKRALLIEEDCNVAKKELYVKGNAKDEVIISYKIKTKDMNSFDKYKFDWYFGYFGDINFSKYSSLNEELKNENIIIGDINFGTYNRCGYAILEVLAYTDRKEEFVKKVQNVIHNYENTSDELEFVKKESILRLSVRSDYISNYVVPVIDNYIAYNYPYNDTIHFVNGLNYEEYNNIIGNIDFSNYSILVVKGNKGGK